MANFLFQHKANEDFTRARWRETMDSLVSLLNPAMEQGISLDEIKELVPVKGESYRGMQAVEVSRIAGSEGRYRDFNRRFLPRYDYLRSRWMRVALARYQDKTLPPIKLYEIGGVYFVRDGNHRVSVARLSGVQTIDAEVVSLNAEISLPADLTREKVLSAVIAWERQRFFDKTGFAKLFPEEELRFTETGRYENLYEHILVHKYYINQTSRKEIPFETALTSWYSSVYRPLVEVIKERRILSRFPDRTHADLYSWIVNHWHVLKQKYGLGVSMTEAVDSFAATYGKGLWAKLLDALYSVLLLFVKKK